MHLISTWLRLILLLIIAYLLLTLAGVWWGVRIALTPPPTASVKALRLPMLGVNVALTASTASERQAALARLQATGFGWVRQRFDWGELEPMPGQYDWHSSDAILHEIHVVGLTPVVVLDGSPLWARAPQDQPPTANPLAPPADFQTFARFAAAFAQRYGEQVRFYQIWDEPNIAPHWGNRLIEPVGYAQLLKGAATAIRAADPDAVIVTAALAPTRDRGHTAIDEPYFLQRLYAAGAAPYFDVVAIEPFGFGDTPYDRRARPDLLNFDRAQLIRRTLVAAGAGATPIWAVRYGWNRQPAAPWATVSTADQLRFATEALTRARQEWPWLTALGWAIDQPAAPTSDPTWGFALTPALATAFRAWVDDGAESHRLKPVADKQNPLKRVRSMLLLWGEGVGWPLLIAVVLGRAWLLMRELPWAKSGTRYRGWTEWGRAGVWLALGIVYYFATWPGLILLCWLAAIVLLGWQPRMGLWLAAALIPFFAQHKEFTLGAFTVAVAPSHMVLLCLAVAIGVKDMRGRASPARAQGNSLRSVVSGVSPARVSTLPLLALGWLLINLLSARNVWQWLAYGEGLWELVLMPLLGGWVVWRLITTRAAVRQLLVALFGGGVAVAVVGLGMWLQGKGTTADGILRLVGPYFSPNGAALYLERIGFVGLGLLVSAEQRQRRWLSGGLLLIAAALFLTASRGAWLLGIPAGLLTFGWLTGPSRRGAVILRILGARRLLIGAGLALGAVLLLTAALALMPRLTNSASLAQRWLTWQAAAQLWRDFPLVGVGPGGFFWRYPAYLPIGALNEPNLHHPHNLWLEIATGWGVLGVLWLILLSGLLLQLVGNGRAGRRAPQPLLAGLVAASAAGFAHAQVDAFLALPDLALWLGLVLPLMVRLSQHPASSSLTATMDLPDHEHHR